MRSAVIIIVVFFLSTVLKAQYKDASYITAAGKDSGTAAQVKDHRLSPGKVALLSLIPGAGQIYNGQWYKAVILYAGLGVMAYYINQNEHDYVTYKMAYRLRTDNNPNTIDQFDTASHTGQPFISDPQTLLDNREYYHHNRDLLYIGCFLVYTAGIIDAYVYAHLRDFNLSNDLSMEIIPVNFSNIAGGFAFTPTIKLKF